MREWLKLIKARDTTAIASAYTVEDLAPETIEFMRCLSSKSLKQLRAAEWDKLRSILREWVAAADIPFRR